MALAAALVLFRGFRSWGKLYDAFVAAGRMSATIIVIVTAIGLIVGLIQVSGFAGRLSLLLSQLANGPLFTTLVVVALRSIVLGMGLPPGAIVSTEQALLALGLKAERRGAVAGLVIFGAGSSKLSLETVQEPLLDRAQSLLRVWLEHRMARRVVIRLNPAK